MIVLGVLALIASGAALYVGISRLQTRADKFDAAYTSDMAMSKDYHPIPKTGFNKDILIICLGLVMLLAAISFFFAATAP